MDGQNNIQNQTANGYYAGGVNATGQYYNTTKTYQPSQAAPKKKSGTGRKVLATLLCAVLFGVLSGGIFLGVTYGGKQIWGSDNSTYVADSNSNSTQGNQSSLNNAGSSDSTTVANTDSSAVIEPTITNPASESTAGMYVTDVSGVAKQCMPSVVSILNTYTEKLNYFGQVYEQQAQAGGSGIIIGQSDTELLLVTNYHVVADTDELMITFVDSSTAEAYIKGYDEDVDIAVIAIPLSSLTTETRDAIAIAVLGDSDSLLVGEPAIAIGNALGYGQSVTLGVISAVNRELELDDGLTHTLIQTDAAINPGNSGGALLNIQGEVVGINSNKIGGTAVEGMGYAIPISNVKELIEELSLKETLVRVEEGQEGYLGIYGQDVSTDASAMYDIPTGVYVNQAIEGQAAEAAGLQKGDIITKLDGNKITCMNDLTGFLQYYAAGTTVDLTLQRKVNGVYQEMTVQITLGQKTAE